MLDTSLCIVRTMQLRRTLVHCNVGGCEQVDDLLCQLVVQELVLDITVKSAEESKRTLECFEMLECGESGGNLEVDVVAILERQDVLVAHV